MGQLIFFLQKIDGFIWQPLFVFLLGTGLFLTFKLRGIQFTKLWYALKLAFTHKDDSAEGDISHFQALMTALAATIGIGNIAGVATAIAMGGLGSLFWLWLTALIGMATKYSEAILAIKYRTIDKRGEMAGGPMYYIEKGIGWKWLAVCFALFGAINTLFTGNIVQSHSIASAMASTLPLNEWVIGVLLAVCTGLVLIGGIRSIGGVTSILVPIMAVFYIMGSLVILFICYDKIPQAIVTIFHSAFTGQAAVGGFVGSTVMMGIQMGVARGIFSNESGLGTAPIAAAAAKTDIPGRQALISMTGAFLSTIVCTFTGLAIAVTDVLGKAGQDGTILNGVPLTMAAFESVIPFGSYFVMIGSILFGYSTIVGWAYYGEKCCEYLFGTKSIFAYRLIFVIFILIGVAFPLELVWCMADIANAFMAIPNLIALLILASVAAHQTKIFLEKVNKERKVLKPLAEIKETI